MSSFDWKKNVEDSIKGALIITATMTGIFYVLKAANVKPPKPSVPGCYGYHETCWWNSGRVLLKDYAVYKKWIKEYYYNKNFYGP